MTATTHHLLLRLLIATSLYGCAHELTEAEAPLHEQTEALETSSLDFDVSLRSTGKASIHASVFNNDKISHGETALAIHGLAETAATYEPLARALFADPAVGRRLKRVIAIDLVGHGESGYPEGLPDGSFGQLTIDDNVSVIIQSLRILASKRLGAQTVIGHSMGGLALQAAQQALLAQGSSLAALGVSKAVLLAPVPPRDRPWTQPAAGNLSLFFVTDPVLGTYLALPPEVFVPFAFGTRAGTVAPNAPTPAEVLARGYVGYEPAVTLAQLVGSPLPAPGGGTVVLPRPAVSAGAFALRHKTALALLSFSEDTLVPAADLADLYRYLTGDTRGHLYLPVVAPDAVHDMFVSNPKGIVAAVRSPI